MAVAKEAVKTEVKLIKVAKTVAKVEIPEPDPAPVALPEPQPDPIVKQAIEQIKEPVDEKEREEEQSQESLEVANEKPAEPDSPTVVIPKAPEPEIVPKKIVVKPANITLTDAT